MSGYEDAYGESYEESCEPGYSGGLPRSFRARLDQTVRALQQAQTPEATNQAKKALEVLLGDYFDNDIKRRQAELAKIMQRVASLEALLEKRQAAKEEIIELQLKTMVNESQGLGFIRTPGPGGPGAYGLFGAPSAYGGYRSMMYDAGGANGSEGMGGMGIRSRAIEGGGKAFAGTEEKTPQGTDEVPAAPQKR